MMEQLTGKFEFKMYLPHDTAEKVYIIGACLIGAGNEVIVKCSCMQSPEGEANNFLNVLKWMMVDYEFYHLSGNNNVIIFINGSKIIFSEYKMPERTTVTSILTLPGSEHKFDTDYPEAWQGGK